MNKKSTLRSVANNYLTHPNTKSGITLIALVVTIIVLLLLAGISIQMLTGDNGILQRAGQAKESTERSEIIENARLDILSQMTENRGRNITESELKSILNKYFKDVPNTLPMDLSELDLTSTNGKYIINAKEIYDGKILQAAGLYNDDGYTPWDTLISNNVLNVNNNVLSKGENINDIKGKLIIDDSITDLGNGIGNGTFYRLNGLTEVIIPNNVTELSDGVFSSCTGLSSVILGDNINKITGSAFAGCTSLKSIKIPDSVEEISYGAFASCTQLTNLEISSNTKLKKLNYGSFSGCSSLKSIYIPNCLDSLTRDVFNGCSSLEEITIGYNGIDSVYFSGNSSLKKVVLVEGTQTIGESAFADCTSLSNISIPDSVTSIKHFAFLNCSNLTTISLPNELTEIYQRTFENCTSLTNIHFSNKLKKIHEDAFKGCTNLTNVELPDSLELIGGNAFGNCEKLNSIYIPENVTTAASGSSGNTLFVGCPSTLVIYCGASEKPSGWSNYWNYGFTPEGESHHHTGRISFDRLINEFSQFREGHNLLVLALQKLLAVAHDRAVEKNILSSGKLVVKSASQLQHRGYTSGCDHRAAGRPVDTGDTFQQRGFPGPVGPDHPDDLSPLHLKAYIVKRIKILILQFPFQTGNHPFLHTRRMIGIHAEVHAHMIYPNYLSHLIV